MNTPRLSSVARNAVFAPLDQLSRPDLVARRLSDAIALGLLPDAEQLPSENDLAERFGVSTVTVRQALSVLREQGLVETRRGRGGGSFVRAPSDPAGHVLHLRLRDMSPTDVRDLGDHYAAIGGAAAALAAERADADDIGRVRSAADLLAAATDARSRRRAEGRFHLEVGAAAQSARLTREEIVLQREIAPLLWLPATTRRTVRAAVDEHAAITDAIARQDAVAARACAEQHVHAAIARVRELQRKLSRS